MAPVDTAPLFAPLLAELLALLRGLTPGDWHRSTVAGRWRVRDIAAHLLDGDLRKIAVYRDQHLLVPEEPIDSPQALAIFINGINASGVRYAERLSPALLTDLLAVTGGWVADLVMACPPHGRSVFPVSWAGETESENWMDIGREYTERWHHQMQIRDAVGAPLLLQPRWLTPLIDIAARAWPPAYAGLPAPPGAAVQVEVRGETDTDWALVSGEGAWHGYRGRLAEAACTVRMSADTAWRLLFNALTPDEMQRRCTISGDAVLAAPLLRARAVIV